MGRAISPLKHVNAFKDAGKKVDYELFDFGTHNLDDAANRKKAMELMDGFCESNLNNVLVPVTIR
ncbi:MAG: hypothetical protein MJK04_13280 [Psychrosphaera sp.]|nr:hypothetical protein [Psychrosphaera sp.]